MAHQLELEPARPRSRTVPAIWNRRSSIPGLTGSTLVCTAEA
jgi:hypothetical protein